MAQTVTYDFKKGWQLRCSTRNSMQERRAMKASAHRRLRRRLHQALTTSHDTPILKPMTGWDVV